MIRKVLWPLLFLAYFFGLIGLIILVIVGAIIARIYRIGGWPAEHIKSNCWSYAVSHWLKDPKYSFLIVRMSYHIPMPHVLFAKHLVGLHTKEYLPDHAELGMHPINGFGLWYKGKVIEKIQGPPTKVAKVEATKKEQVAEL